jgi:Tol biopolymer transport system component
VASFDVKCDADHRTDNPAAIVFQRGQSIMLIDEDGRADRTLTMGVAPSWATDRSFLVFQRPHCQDWGCDDHLWTIRPDGSGERQITETAGFLDYDPVISPDGRSVAFVRFWNGPDQTYLIVRDVNGIADAILSIWDPYSTPAWSPDGSQIAFTCEGPSPYWDVDLCVVQRTAGCDTYFVNVCQGRMPAVVHLTSTRFVESDPAWSPDGSRIAFTLACGTAVCPSGVKEGESYIALLDVETKQVSLLTPGHSPAWSPGGDRIVYARGGSNPGLFVIDSNGTTPKRITDDPRDANPSWR